MTDAINVIDLGFGDGDYVITNKTDAMAPAILADDQLVVRPGDQATEGQVVIAKVNEEATCRRFRRNGSTVHLEAENPTIDNIEAPAADVKVLGVVVGLMRRLA